jgi:hypothetical protein
VTVKKSAANRPSRDPSAPRASRPQLPPEYGVSRNPKGLLPWAHVTTRLARSLHYWVCTVGPGGRPHATPVDGLWLDDRLYFGGSPRTRRQRNLAANPEACVHLESGSDVVILHGEVHAERPDRSLAKRLAQGSVDKYGYAPRVEDYEANDVQVFRPRVAFAWTHFPKDATRWHVRDEDRGK